MYVWIKILIWVLLFGLNESRLVAAFEDQYGREKYPFAMSESSLSEENKPEGQTIYLGEPELEESKKKISLLRRIKRFFKTRKKTDDVSSPDDIPSIEEARKALQGRKEYEKEHLIERASQPPLNPRCIGNLSLYPEKYDVATVKKCIISLFLAKNYCNKKDFPYYVDRLSYFIDSIKKGSDSDKDEKVENIQALIDNFDSICAWIQGLKALKPFFNKEDLIGAIDILYQE